MVEVVDRRAARRTIFCRNVRQNSARIARTVFNVAVCRTFLRSVLLWVIDPQRMVTDRHGMDTDRSHKYRPPGNESFCGAFFPR